MGRKIYPLLSFAAGLANGYFNAEKDKSENERQDKFDQITFDKAAREKQEYDDKEAIQKKIEGIPVTDNSTKAPLSAQGLTLAMPGVFQDEQTAQNFIDNPNATADQKAAVMGDYAKQGLSSGDNTQIVADKNGLASQDPTQTTQRKPWQILQDKSSIYLSSGKPEYQDSALKMLEFSQKLKSDDYKNQIVTARQKGLNGLLDLMHNHDNNELGIVNPRIEYSDDGKTAYLTGETPDGKAIPRNPNNPNVTFDLRNGSVEDQLTQTLLAQSTPEALSNHILNTVQQAHANRQEDRADKDEVRKDADSARADKSLAETIAQHGVDNSHFDQTFEANREDKKIEHGIQTQQIGLEGQKVKDAHDDRVLAINAKLVEDRFKDNTKYRENLQAAVGDFDKSFARDALGNLSGSALNSSLYAEAVKHMGDRIEAGAPIASAVAEGRKLYDTAMKLSSSGDKNAVENAKKTLTGTAPAAPTTATPAATKSGDYSSLWKK